MSKGFLGGDLPNPFDGPQRSELVVIGLSGPSVNYHKTPDDLYRQLVAAFGEQEHEGTRWVAFGAGSVALRFFPLRDVGLS